jgi:hypothetical protein
MVAILLQATAVLRAAFLPATASAVVLLADYSVAVAISSSAHGLVPVVFGSGLLLAAELAAWSVDLASTGVEPARLAWRRVRLLAVVALGSAAFSVAVVTAAAQLGNRQGLLIRGVGIAAAVAVVAILARLSARSGLRPDRQRDGRRAASG